MNTFDPLFHARCSPGTGIGGVIKQQPGDFFVYEVPFYEPCGEGEHLYLRIRKEGLSHAELIRLVAKAYGVKEAAIGFAGMKDRVAVTEQTISIHLPGTGETRDIEDDRITVLWADRHGNKLRRGHLGGNRFVIRIRDVDPLRVMEAWKSLECMAGEGVPNAVGSQRFGREGNNHLLGLCMLQEAWPQLAELLLGGTGGRLEFRVRSAIDGGAEPAEACRLIPGRMRRFWNDALQSALFNRVLEARMASGNWSRPGVDDLAWNHDTRRTFHVSSEDLDDADTIRRIEAGTLVPTGPLWGRSMRAPGPMIESMERETADGIDPQLVPLLVDHGRSQGARRALCVPLRHPAATAEMDAHGGCIMVQFELPPGAYATTVLQEIMGVESASTVPGSGSATGREES